MELAGLIENALGWDQVALVGRRLELDHSLGQQLEYVSPRMKPRAGHPSGRSCYILEAGVGQMAQ